MRHFNPSLMGRAAITRIDTGEPLTQERVLRQMASFGDGMTKAQLLQVVAYLAARVLANDLKQDAAREPTEHDLAGAGVALAEVRRMFDPDSGRLVNGEPA